MGVKNEKIGDPASMEIKGEYRFIRRIGGGDYAEVLLCESGTEQVAMKVFSVQSRRLQHLIETSEEDLEARLCKRFIDEAKLVEGLKHPNIVAVLEISALADDRPCFVMPYLPTSLRGEIFGAAADAGHTLAPRRAPQTLPVERITGVLRQVLAGLAEVHAQGIVHRDLKPDHIRFDKEGTVRLVDFSVAKTPWAGYTPIRQDFGTKNFMSPEQAVNATDVDARSDVYSVGAIAYLALTGRYPGTKATLPQELGKGVPDSLDRWVMAALANDRERRPENAAVLLELLD